jgi:hypothetical protein
MNLTKVRHVVLPSIFNDGEFIGSPFERENLLNMHFPFGPHFEYCSPNVMMNYEIMF